MASRFQDAIDELVAEITTKVREVSELKRTVNLLLAKGGQQPMYEEVEEETVRGGVAGLRPDQFYGKSPTLAAREYLDLRGQAVPPDEIVTAMERGGFDFKAQGWTTVENRVRNLAISMGKNTGIFHRLPNGFYGLTKWYPDAPKKPRRPSAGAESPESVEEATEEEA